MTENIRVTCLLNRSWDIATKQYVGNSSSGTLIDISVQGEEDELFPVGIVLMDDNTFQNVPMEFITKIQA